MRATPRAPHYQVIGNAIEGGAFPMVAFMLDATQESALRILEYRDNRKHLESDQHAAQDLRCERCNRWLPLDQIAMPGVDDFICRSCT